MTALVVCGDALRLPLADQSVDLVVTSPPCWRLRAYGSGHPGELGSEPTPDAYLAGLWAATAELARVLKPSGSIFINLGDKYHSGQSRLEELAARWRGGGHTDHLAKQPSSPVAGLASKSLLGLPWAYALGCTGMLAALGGPDPGLNLTLRAELVWAKPNPLPEPVTDRVRRSHEVWLHLVKQPRYYTAIDELREPHSGNSHEAGPNATVTTWESGNRRQHRTGRTDTALFHPLGRLPGSVWPIPSEPLQLPDWLGVRHYAAFPTEWPRRLILGWSPPGICTICGQGRRPVPHLQAVEDRRGRVQGRQGDSLAAAHGPDGRAGERYRAHVTIAGYACACTPYSDHPEHRRPSVTRQDSGELRVDQVAYQQATGSRDHGSGNGWPQRRPVRQYHLDGWRPPPTRPAVVLDPFCGTGTTVMAARALGRVGIGVDLRWDYCRAARWRTFDPAQAATTLARTWAERQTRLTGQEGSDP